MKRFLSPVWFLLIAAAFTLPFISVSCQAPPGLGDLGGEFGGELGEVPTQGFEITATGLDLVLGSEPDVSGDPTFTEAAQGQDGGDNEPSLFAIIAFAAAVLGIFLSPLRGRLGGVFTLVLAAFVALGLLLLRTNVSGELPAQAAQFLQINYEIGYWAALLLGLVALGWGLWRVLSREEVVVATPTATAPPVASGTATAGGTGPLTGTGFERPAPPPSPGPAPETAEPTGVAAGPEAAPPQPEAGAPETAGPPAATPPGGDEPGTAAREDQPPPPPA